MFFKLHCKIRNTKSKVVACGYREESLYYLDHEVPVHQAHTGSAWSVVFKAGIWHRLFGRFQGLQALAKNRMVKGLVYDWKRETGFCEPCAGVMEVGGGAGGHRALIKSVSSYSIVTWC